MRRLLLALFVLTLGCVLCAQAQPQWPAENHYKVYFADPPQTYAAFIQLTDQFGGYTVETLALEKFANPVEKNGEPILFPETHHTWWRVDLTGLGWIIEVENQFGPQVWRVSDPEYLVLPARKYEDGPPLQNNHYLAYRAEGQPIDLPVDLVDQFGQMSGIVLEPMWFLNPVEKVHEGALYPIVDPEAHLACYRIDPPMPYNILVTAYDQFGIWDFTVVDHECLCVPSYKLEVVRTETRSWSDIKGLFR